MWGVQTCDNVTLCRWHGLFFVQRRGVILKCENCSGYESDFAPVVSTVKTLIPLGGHTITLKFKDLRAHRRNNCARTIWVCGSMCDLQTRAIAAMGLPTHRWPMTLAEFTRQTLKQLRNGLTVKSTSDNSQCLPGSQGSKEEEMTLPHQEVVSGPRKGGRPRVKNRKSPAEYQRAYRERQRACAIHR